MACSWVGTSAARGRRHPDGQRTRHAGVKQYCQRQRSADEACSRRANHTLSLGADLPCPVDREDCSGTFWVGTSEGLNEFDREAGKVTFISRSSERQDPPCIEIDLERLALCKNMPSVSDWKRPSKAFSLPQRPPHPPIYAALDGHGVRAGGHRFDALTVDSLGQNCGGGCPVAGNVGRLRRHVANHPGAHILQRVL